MVDVETNVVSWNAMILGHIKHGCWLIRFWCGKWSIFLDLFITLCNGGYIFPIMASIDKDIKQRGQWKCSWSFTNDRPNSYLQNNLLNMSTTCGTLVEGKRGLCNHAYDRHCTMECIDHMLGKQGNTFFGVKEMTMKDIVRFICMIRHEGESQWFYVGSFHIR